MAGGGHHAVYRSYGMAGGGHHARVR
jgi:hypothetical protein